MVAQIDKEQTTMVALGVNPARKPGGLTDIGGPQGSAMMRTIGVNLFHNEGKNLYPASCQAVAAVWEEYER